MKITRTTVLNEEQREQIRSIVEECKKSHPLSLTFPFDDGSVYYLLSDPYPVCALAFIMPEHTAGEPDFAAECVAFTLPAKQNRGYFTALFQKAEEEIRDIDLFFLTDGSDEGALKTLESLSAEPDHCEHRMELDPGKCPTPDLRPEETRLTACGEHSGEELTFSFFLKQGNGSRPAGVCHFALYEKSACLYGFEIEKSLRKTGLGREALLIALNLLKTYHDGPIVLQVSGDNAPALHLYEKTGFRISETLYYYLY